MMKNKALNVSKALIDILLSGAILVVPILLIGLLFLRGDTDDKTSLMIMLGATAQSSASWMFAIMVSIQILAEVAIGVYVLWQAREFLKAIKSASYFTEDNVKRLKSIGFWLLIECVVHFGGGFLILLTQGHLELSISITMVVLALVVAIVYVVAEVFAHGVRIQQEQDLTI